MLVATSEADPSALLAVMSGAVTACGGWVLAQGVVSAGCADIDFEFPRDLCFEIYGLMVGSGMELSLEAHQQLTELCRCTRQRIYADEETQSTPVRLHLSVYLRETSGSFLGDTNRSLPDAA